MRRFPLPLAVFCLFQGLYLCTASGRVDRVADEFEVYFQVESLWERQTLAIDQVPDAVFFGAKGRDGHRYAPYGPGFAFSALAHHALGRGLVGALGLEPRGEDLPSYMELLSLCTSLSTTTWAALAVVGLFLALRALGASERRALAVSGLLGVGSVLWPYASVFYSEAVAGACAIWAVALHLRGRTRLAACALAGLALIKATHACAAAGLLAVCAADPRTRRQAGLYAGAIAGAALVHASYNWLRFGAFSDFGYRWTESGLFGLAADGSAAEPQPFSLARLPRALVGLLLSPGKSLFLFAPGLVLLADPARWRAWRGSREVYTLALGGLLVALGFYGSYFFWAGGYAVGPRHLVPAIPLAFLPLARGRLRGARPALLLGAAVALLSVSAPFLEDQGIGEDLDRPREVYYWIDREAAPGAPKNVYRLDYVPWGRAARHLVQGIAASDPSQQPAWLGSRLRVLAARPEVQIPGWLGPGLLVLSWGLLALGVGAIARRDDLLPARSGVPVRTRFVS
ncbi:MAG: hypothetical protein R3F62_04985 [Planctomycetota bacterium]